MKRSLPLMVLLVVAMAGPGWSMSDPTRPPGVSDKPAAPVVKKKAALNLQSILYSTQRQVAVVNGQALQVGDRIEGMKVTEITPQKVTLRAGSSTRVLTLKKTKLKSRPVGSGN